MCREAEADQSQNGLLLQRSLGFHTPPLSATDSAHFPPPLQLSLLSPHPTASVCTTLFPWKANRNIKLQLGEAPKNITSGRQNGIPPSPLHCPPSRGERQLSETGFPLVTFGLGLAGAGVGLGEPLGVSLRLFDVASSSAFV